MLGGAREEGILLIIALEQVRKKGIADTPYTKLVLGWLRETRELVFLYPPRQNNRFTLALGGGALQGLLLLLAWSLALSFAHMQTILEKYDWLSFLILLTTILVIIYLLLSSLCCCLDTVAQSASTFRILA